MPKKIRVRSKRLERGVSSVDETKLSLALWLLARDGLVIDKTSPADAATEASKTNGRSGEGSA